MSALKDKSWYSFCNVCDVNVLQECHQTVLKQGQSVSSYYRMMVKDGTFFIIIIIINYLN